MNKPLIFQAININLKKGRKNSGPAFKIKRLI